jgi:hypothetical protein
MSDPACSCGGGFHLRQRRAGMIQERSTRRCQFDAASAACQESRTYLVLKISNLPA